MYIELNWNAYLNLIEHTKRHATVNVGKSSETWWIEPIGNDLIPLNVESYTLFCRSARVKRVKIYYGARCRSPHRLIRCEIKREGIALTHLNAIPLQRHFIGPHVACVVGNKWKFLSLVMAAEQVPPSLLLIQAINSPSASCRWSGDARVHKSPLLIPLHSPANGATERENFSSCNDAVAPASLPFRSTVGTGKCIRWGINTTRFNAEGIYVFTPPDASLSWEMITLCWQP